MSTRRGRPHDRTSPPIARAALAFAICAGGAACGGRAQAPADAAQDLPAVDAPITPDSGPKPLAVDFSATGCASFDRTASRCDGVTPLTLLFTPIVSEELTRFLWTFGDGTVSSSERSPTHTYAAAGEFTVTLTAGGASGVGSVQRTHLGYVNVLPAPVGAWCDVDSQCAPGLTCWCGSMNPCAPVLSRGVCSRPCDAASGGPTACPDSSLCADLSSGVPVTGAGGSSPISMSPTPNVTWRRPLCLPACTSDGDCADGLSCRDLQAAPAGGWIRGCFGSYPLPIGARCGDVANRAVDADCTSRLCANLGAFGRCASDCSAAGCPVGAACGHFGDGRNLCLLRCAAPSDCDDDPLLACEASGGAGPLGFVVSNGAAAPPATFCAPKRCTTAADCGTIGTCPPAGGNCQKLP